MQRSSPERAELPLLARLVDVTREYWSLGLTSFGGPAVHITILRKRFVPRVVDETIFTCAQAVRRADAQGAAISSR